MAGLEIQIAPVDGDPAARRLQLVGVIDDTTAEELERAVAPLRQQGVSRLLLGMQRVRYVNSAGLNALVRLTDEMKAAGGGVALVDVAAKVKIMIDMMGMTDHLLICAGETEALGKLAERAGQAAAWGPPAAGPPRAAAAAPPAAVTAPAAPAAAAELYPAAVACGACGLEIELPSPGNWKCPRCEVVLAARADGSVSFSLPDRRPPLELVLWGAPEAVEGLKRFAAAVAERVLGNGQAAALLAAAVEEVARGIVHHAYHDDATRIFQVAIEPGEAEVQVQLADHGSTLDSSQLASYFPTASSRLAAFECRPHPRGGNVIRMVARA